MKHNTTAIGDGAIEGAKARINETHRMRGEDE